MLSIRNVFSAPILEGLGAQIGDLLGRYGLMYAKGLLATVVLSLVGTFGGLFLGVFFAFGKRLRTKGLPWYQKLWRYPIKGFCQLYSLVIRGTPMMVQALLFKYLCVAAGLNWNDVLRGVDTWNGWMIAGLIVITLNTAAYMCEDILSGLNGVDRGQTEGAKSLGLSDFKTLIYVTLPQALRNAIPTIGNEWIVNIKDSSVLNVIAVSELFYQANMVVNKNYKFLASYLIIALIYLLLTLLATGFLKLVERKMDGKKFHLKWTDYFLRPKALGRKEA